MGVSGQWRASLPPEQWVPEGLQGQSQHLAGPQAMSGRAVVVPAIPVAVTLVAAFPERPEGGTWHPEGPQRSPTHNLHGWYVQANKGGPRGRRWWHFCVQDRGAEQISTRGDVNLRLERIFLWCAPGGGAERLQRWQQRSWA